MGIIDDLLKISVKLICNENEEMTSEGSGTIISDGTDYYVMTAGHCIRKDSKSFYTPSNIDVLTFCEEKPRKIEVKSIVEGSSLEEDKDMALLRIADPGIDFNFKDRVKRCDVILDEEEYFLYGFGNPNNLLEKGRKFILERRGLNDWHLRNDYINNQDISAMKLMGGNSGAGIFFKRLDVYYCIGFAKRLLDEEGSFNDLIVYPSSFFDGLMPEETKESNFFGLIDAWTKMVETKLDDEARQDYKKKNSEFMDNLSRKIKVLFPHEDEFVNKIQLYLDYYLKGMKLDAQMWKSPYLMKKLKGNEEKIFKKHIDERSIYFDNPHQALEDMLKIKNAIKEAANEIFSDFQYRDMVEAYVNYNISDKLLRCSLNYKKDN